MENIYEIYTDASFDDYTKLATYSVVIIKNKKLLKAFGKKIQEEIGNVLNLSSTNINRIFYKLRELKILEKKANGRYFLII